MDTKKMLLELIEDIDNERILRLIYFHTAGLTKNKG